MGVKLQTTGGERSVQRRGGVQYVPDVSGVDGDVEDGAGRGDVVGESVAGDGDGVLSATAVLRTCAGEEWVRVFAGG